MVKRWAQRFFSLFILTLFLLVTFSSSVFAQQNDIYKSLQWPFYDPETSTDGCVDTTLVGSENAEKTWNYLTGKGLSKIATAALMGNIKDESGFNPTALNPTSGAFGIVQWLGNRLTSLNQFATDSGLPNTDLGLQLNFMWKELSGSYKKTITNVINSPSATIEGATQLVYDYYEGLYGSGQGSVTNRITNARNFLAKYGSISGGDSSSPDSSVCGTDSSGQVTGNYSLPVDKKWYSQNPSWFTKPHHDYPAADIPVPDGTKVYAASSGIVTIINDALCGKGINIDAGNNITFTYCHGSDSGSIDGVKNGDQVKAGQLIMHVDSTGHSTGPHLHFGIKVGETRFCPQNFLVATATGKVPDIKSLPSSGCTY